jgi:hypothetical protein
MATVLRMEQMYVIYLKKHGFNVSIILTVISMVFPSAKTPRLNGHVDEVYCGLSKETIREGFSNAKCT